jgi:hypothetical protein
MCDLICDASFVCNQTNFHVLGRSFGLREWSPRGWST